MGVTDIRFYFLRYKNYSNSRLSIRFTAWYCKWLFLTSVLFAINTNIAAKIVLLVATVFAGI